ncbi:MAG TPA: hypothetical protein VL120_14365 [Solirubrobacteraceae bacterium]|nr:hypothetical protein [Solirubrobacteraceae bacterium]
MAPTDIVEPPEQDLADPGEPAVSRMPPRWLLGAALVLLGAGAILVSTAYDRGPAASRLGANAPVNAGAGNQLDISAHNSPSLVRSPVDAKLLVVANRIETPRYSCALHVSRDAGASWSQTPIPLPAGEEPKCYAPDVAFGADGTLYMTFVTLHGTGNVPHAVWLTSSQDGGRTLGTPTKVLPELAFQVRLVADPAKAGRLYVTWLQASDVGLFRFSETGNPIRAIRSDDGGRTWTRRTRVSSPARGRVVAPVPALGPGGDLYVLYLDLGDDRLDYDGVHQGRGGPPYDGRFSLVLARSRDQAATWQESVVDTKIVPTQRFIAFIPPLPALAVDQHSGRLYAAFEDGRDGDPDVMLWTLGPRDARWSGPRRVNDTPQGDGRAQYRPQLSVGPGGRLDVVYYDRRRDPRNRRNEVSLQSSFDDGRSFSPSIALSDRSFDSQIGQGYERGLPEFGNRLASLSTKDRMLAVWTDTRNSVQVSGKQDLMHAIAVFSDPPRLGAFPRALLRYGGLLLLLLGLALVVPAVAAAHPLTRARAGLPAVAAAVRRRRGS